MKLELKRSDQGFTLIELLVVITIIAILAGAAVPAFNLVQERANQTDAQGRARQIIASLRIYAGDHEGIYPDGGSNDEEASTSNDAFRKLFKEGCIDAEQVFGCKASKYQPDKNIGEKPEYEQALENGENHWAMTKGITDSSGSSVPLVFENPVTTGWPPQWDADKASKPAKGRTWKGGKVVIGFNDSSVRTETLDGSSGTVGPKDIGNGKNIFTQAEEEAEVLDIAE